MSARITVVGLGSGDPDKLTLGSLKSLQGAGERYVRTKDHPVVAWLEETGVSFVSFDDVYEAKEDFPSVYEEIAARLLKRAEYGPAGMEIVYAVPGHPMVAEATVKLLRERCPQSGIELEIVGGESFLDEAFVRLGFDPIEGFALLDATAVNGERIDPRRHTLIGQVYDQLTASEVKLGLMEVFPDDYPVVVGHALGVAGQEQIRRIPLYELDRIDGYGNLSLVYVPASEDEALRIRSFERLHEIVTILRSPGGCPWDREQTHQSIRKNLIEETYEVLETIDDDDPDHMREELGDLLLQIMLHSQMEEELGTFTVYDVIRELNEKLLYRHPHVFGNLSAEDAEAALNNWEAMKAEEKRRKGIKPEQQSALSGVPRDLPALMKAYKLQKKAAKAGFDWEQIDGVWDKLEEEIAELKQAVQDKLDPEAQELELGDVLFSVVNAARYIGADPEQALSRTIAKFTRRFHYVEERLRAQGKTPGDSSLSEMDVLWEEAKSKERE
ncbi:nucleoside triphosphate pyrophosphohydrolase [Paenibacillus macerans]|uniref:nucleoside triphosphate pyrophosphohydrolase n=1 Tax=Paenibacillus macerans TaxID=44252 RepID=UPI000EBE33E6|nr:nucleoside triphosphate pyrophosphohydrolase [Paenibacillus macerans]MBS5910830.1 nucleoside triphosphate pyrophosphohydrolase [Paenibacillus macerans]GBK65889.1 MazG family protein [Paenibacillus macerans]GBK72114.1 MazG family protein [Paenibacillus macerans]